MAFDNAMLFVIVAYITFVSSRACVPDFSRNGTDYEDCYLKLQADCESPCVWLQYES